jgi:hypothetical protein
VLYTLVLLLSEISFLEMPFWMIRDSINENSSGNLRTLDHCDGIPNASGRYIESVVIALSSNSKHRLCNINKAIKRWTSVYAHSKAACVAWVWIAWCSPTLKTITGSTSISVIYKISHGPVAHCSLRIWFNKDLEMWMSSFPKRQILAVHNREKLSVSGDADIFRSS